MKKLTKEKTKKPAIFKQTFKVGKKEIEELMAFIEATREGRR